MLKANYTFLLNADESILRKASQYEFDSIEKYMSAYPTVYNFPIIAIVSLGLMTYFINYFTIVAVSIFILLSVMLYCVTHMSSKANLAYEFRACQRALIVDEMMQKFKNIKNDTME